MNFLYKRIFLGLVIGFCLAQAFPGQAQIRQAKVREILDGPQVYIQEKQAQVNDLADRGQKVRTGESRTELGFDNNAVMRLSKNSLLVVGKCVLLQKGTLLINGAVNGCTSNIVAGVRGTTYLLEVDDTGKQQVRVLEGEVTIARQDVPEVSSVKQLGSSSSSNNSSKSDPAPALPKPPTTAPQEVTLKSGQEVEVSPKGDLGIIQNISQQDFEALLTGNLFTGFSVQIPAIDKVQQEFSRLFPGVPFPIQLPNINLPSIPGLPFRLPF